MVCSPLGTLVYISRAESPNPSYLQHSLLVTSKYCKMLNSTYRCRCFAVKNALTSAKQAQLVVAELLDKLVCKKLEWSVWVHLHENSLRLSRAAVGGLGWRIVYCNAQVKRSCSGRFSVSKPSYIVIRVIHHGLPQCQS